MAGIIKLESSDGMIFEVDKAVALKLKRIEDIVEDVYATDSPISVPDVTGEILSRVVNYCTVHTGSEADDNNLKAFDASFVRVDESTLMDLLLAAYNLNIKSLLDLVSKAVARIMDGKTVAEAREMLNLHVTPEEDEELRRMSIGYFEVEE